MKNMKYNYSSEYESEYEEELTNIHNESDDDCCDNDNYEDKTENVSVFNMQEYLQVKLPLRRISSPINPLPMTLLLNLDKFNTYEEYEEYMDNIKKEKELVLQEQKKKESKAICDAFNDFLKEKMIDEEFMKSLPTMSEGMRIRLENERLKAELKEVKDAEKSKRDAFKSRISSGYNKQAVTDITPSVEVMAARRAARRKKRAEEKEKEKEKTENITIKTSIKTSVFFNDIIVDQSDDEAEAERQDIALAHEKCLKKYEILDKMNNDKMNNQTSIQNDSSSSDDDDLLNAFLYLKNKNSKNIANSPNITKKESTPILDKKEIAEKLSKTRMCNSILNNMECRHGTNCRFAHTLNELVIRNCFYGDNCNIFSTCQHKHPKETIDEYHLRLNLVNIIKPKNTHERNNTSTPNSSPIFLGRTAPIPIKPPTLVLPVISELDLNRDVAFDTLSNKKDLAQKLVKTRMCNSVLNKQQCRHGVNCRFAHNRNELVISNCFFKDDCKYFNTCVHKHPKETTDSYYTRVEKL